MSGSENEPLRQAVARVLETDYLLGMRHVPLIIPAAASPPSAGQKSGPTPPAACGPASRPVVSASPVPRPIVPAHASAAAPAVGPVVANQTKVLRLDLSAEEYAARRQKIAELAERVAYCRRCHLAETRTKVVPGQGDVRTRLVFVGEAPGFDEDQQGLAFVGKAGQLLTKMIEAMGLSRDWVYICNILKCRPPDNRTPVPDEITACWPFLDEQLRIIQPDIIVALGKPASQTLLRTDESIGQLRGVWREYYCSGTVGVGEPIALMPTYHPAYLLRSPGEKGKVWSDLKQVMSRLGLTPPGG